MTKLPYSFDLLWDFKTVQQLHDHLTGRQRYATSATDFELITLAQELNVPLPSSINVEPPLAVAMRAIGARVPETATHYWLCGAGQQRGGRTTLHLMFFRESESDPSGWQQFVTDLDDEYPGWRPGPAGFRGDYFQQSVIQKLRKLEGNK